MGPFDWFRVPTTVWTTLLKLAEESRIYVGAVNRIIPLDRPDRLDKDVKDYAHSHLAFRCNIFDGTVD